MYFHTILDHLSSILFSRLNGISLDELQLECSWKNYISGSRVTLKVEGLLMEGAYIDTNGTLHENLADSPVLSRVPNCHMAWMSEVNIIIYGILKTFFLLFIVQTRFHWLKMLLEKARKIWRIVTIRSNSSFYEIPSFFSLFRIQKITFITCLSLIASIRLFPIPCVETLFQ